jgi:hypothetical protein
MKKSERMEEFAAGLRTADPSSEVDPCYLGYFECFNEGRYYEAHDVLEHLWLKGGRSSPDYGFHKGLIQLAGAFVHLKLQRENPSHPKHGRRMRPARRLFLLAIENLSPYAPHHRGMSLSLPLELAARFAVLIEEGRFEQNPWDPESAPKLPFPAGRKI